MKVYFDNAATTALDPQVLESMMPYLTEHYGNPSSTHNFGRQSKSAIETARKNIAKYLCCSPMEIFFTSCGTEADNMAIAGAVRDLGVTRIVSSPIEHHAIGHALDACDKEQVKIEMVRISDKGHVDTAHLREILGSSEEKTLVTLMHANNEVGTMIDLEEIGNICEEYGAYFHSDTVQTVGHFKIDLSKLKLHFITGSAHKFHGPKGVGFLYVSKKVHISAIIYGGSQERNLRAGTENIYGIVGMSKALELAYQELDQHVQHISGLKIYMKEKLQQVFPDAMFNGCPERSLYTVLNVSLPESENASMLLFLLDMDGIAASAGSACSSGSNQGSHVLRALNIDGNKPSLRFSFSKFNTKAEVDYVVERLKAHLGAEVLK